MPQKNKVKVSHSTTTPSLEALEQRSMLSVTAPTTKAAHHKHHHTAKHATSAAPAVKTPIIIGPISPEPLPTFPNPIIVPPTTTPQVTLNEVAGVSFTADLGSTGSLLKALPPIAVTNKPVPGEPAPVTPIPTPGPAGQVIATINWGDGQTSIGKLIANGKGGYDVSGTHSYIATGNFKIQIVVTSSPAAGSTGVTRTLATINDLAIVTAS